MRIPFRNIAHADFTLRTCKRILLEDIGVPNSERVPSQQIRNGFCTKFGYSNYTELQKLMQAQQKSASTYIAPREEDFREALYEGFLNGFHILKKAGIVDFGDDFEVPVTVVSEAFDKLQQEMEIPNGDALGLLEDGEEALAAGRLEYAEDCFQSVIALDKTLPDAFNGLACIELKRKNYEKSFDLAQAAIVEARKKLGNVGAEDYTWWWDHKTRPFIRALHNAGLALWKMRDHKGAVTMFEAILERYPNDADVFLIGTVLLQGKQLSKALRYFKKSAGNDEMPGDTNNEYNYSLALFRAGKLEEAVYRFRYAMFLNPDIAAAISLRPVRERVVALLNSGQRDNEMAEYLDDYISMWHKREREFATAVLFDPDVVSEMDKFYRLLEALHKEDEADKRGPLIDSLFGLRKRRSLMVNNGVVTERVRSEVEAKKPDKSEGNPSHHRRYAAP